MSHDQNVEEIQHRREARGAGDPLTRLRAHSARLIAEGQEPITEQPAKRKMRPRSGYDGPIWPWKLERVSVDGMRGVLVGTVPHTAFAVVAVRNPFQTFSGPMTTFITVPTDRLA